MLYTIVWCCKLCCGCAHSCVPALVLSGSAGHSLTSKGFEAMASYHTPQEVTGLMQNGGHCVTHLC